MLTCGVERTVVWSEDDDSFLARCTLIRRACRAEQNHPSSAEEVYPRQYVGASSTRNDPYQDTDRLFGYQQHGVLEHGDLLGNVCERCAELVWQERESNCHASCWFWRRLCRQHQPSSMLQRTDKSDSSCVRSIVWVKLVAAF